MAVKGRNSHNLLFGARGPFIYVNGIDDVSIL